jgi:hypothetical protein
MNFFGEINFRSNGLRLNGDSVKCTSNISLKFCSYILFQFNKIFHTCLRTIFIQSVLTGCHWVFEHLKNRVFTFFQENLENFKSHMGRKIVQFYKFIFKSQNHEV